MLIEVICKCLPWTTHKLMMYSYDEWKLTGHPCSFIIFQVAFHIQPYRGRNDQSVHDNIKYIIDRWVHVWLPLRCWVNSNGKPLRLHAELEKQQLQHRNTFRVHFRLYKASFITYGWVFEAKDIFFLTFTSEACLKRFITSKANLSKK